MTTSRSKLIREWSYFSESVRKAFEEILISKNYGSSSISVNVAVVQSNGCLLTSDKEYDH